jgi:hypothetical protein
MKFASAQIRYWRRYILAETFGWTILPFGKTTAVNDPMAELKPLDEWGVNNEVLSPELFQRFLRVVQGLEGPREAVFKSFLGSLASFWPLRSIGFSLRFGLICANSRLLAKPLWKLPSEGK